MAALDFSRLIPRRVRIWLQGAFNVTTGHDHDGTNSKTLPAFSTSTGHDHNGTNSKTLPAFSTSTGHDHNGTNSKTLPAFSLTSGHDHDGVNSRSVTRFFHYQVEDLAADGDIAGRTLLVVPTDKVVRLVSASIISQGSAAGVDDDNTCVVVLANNTDAIVTKTYNTATAFPADAALDSLGALDDTHKVMAAGKALKLSVTNGTAANPPAFMLQLVYTLENAS